MINCNGTKCKKMNYNSNDVKYLNLNGTTVWVKPYTLTISRGGGVSSLTVRRTSTKEPSASTGTLSSGATIYHGDTLTVSASASSGYTLNSYTTSYTVSSDLYIYVSAKQNQSPTNVSVRGTITNSGGNYYENIIVSNNTGYSIVVTKIANTALNNGSYNQTISNGNSYTFSKSTKMQPFSGSVTITYTCNGSTYTTTGTVS